MLLSPHDKGRSAFLFQLTTGGVSPCPYPSLSRDESEWIRGFQLEADDFCAVRRDFLKAMKGVRS